MPAPPPTVLTQVRVQVTMLGSNGFSYSVEDSQRHPTDVASRETAALFLGEMVNQMRGLLGVTSAAAVSVSAPPISDDIAELLGDLIELNSAPCRIDHDGDCQEHGWFRRTQACPLQRLRDVLANQADLAYRYSDDFPDLQEILANLANFTRLYPPGSPEPEGVLAVRRQADLTASPACDVLYVRQLDTGLWKAEGSEGLSWKGLNESRTLRDASSEVRWVVRFSGGPGNAELFDRITGKSNYMAGKAGEVEAFALQWAHRVNGEARPAVLA
jgi:hypothetical protein